MINLCARVRSFILSTFALIVMFCLLSCGYIINPRVNHQVESLKQGHYRLDPLHTSVLFKINHMGLSTFVGRFNKVEANLDFDPKNPETSQLSARIYMDTVDVNNPELTDTLKSSDFFDTQKYPIATFSTLAVEYKGGQNFLFKGVLDMHGVKAPVNLLATFNGGADNMLTGKYTLGFTGTADIKRSDFGMDYLAPAVADRVDIEVFAEFQH